MLQVRSTTVIGNNYKKKKCELAASLFDVKLPIARVKLHGNYKDGVLLDHTLYKG